MIIGEKTAISLSISSWWHVIAMVAGVYFLVLTCYFSLKADTKEALRVSAATAAKQEKLEEKVGTIRDDIRSVTEDVKWFRQQYERDQQGAAIMQGRVR